MKNSNFTKYVFILFINLFYLNSRAQITIPDISANEKIFGLSMFWKEASYNFVYFYKIPKLNWDSAYLATIPKVLATKNLYEYSRELKKFSALLKDGHTSVNFYSVDTLVYQHNFGKYKIELREFDKKIYVTNTAQKTKSEIPIGSELITIDNLPAETYLTENILPYISSSSDHIRREEAIRQILSGLKGSKVTIQIKTPENKILTLSLVREPCSDKWVYETKTPELINFKWLENDIAYVAINSFRDGKIDTLFNALIPELKKCKALIIDVRENGGGNSGFANEIVKYLTDKPYFFGEQGSTRKLLSSHKAWGARSVQRLSKYNLDTTSAEFKENYKSDEFRHMYNNYLHYMGNAMEKETTDTIFNNNKKPKLLMPLVVLTGHNTFSAAEDFLISLRYLQRATFIGQNSNGSTGQPLFFKLPGGGSARICTRKCTYPDGKEFIGTGVEPDITVNPSLSDFLNHTDITLKQAIDFLIQTLKISK